MSRIGNLPIERTGNVSICGTDSYCVTVQRPKVELSTQWYPDILFSIVDGRMLVKRPTDQERHKSMHGLYRSILSNMVVGVSEGYEWDFEVIGVGYRAA